MFLGSDWAIAFWREWLGDRVFGLWLIWLYEKSNLTHHSFFRLLIGRIMNIEANDSHSFR